MQSRRQALGTIAAGAAANAQQREHKHEGMVNIKPAPVYKARFFTPEEFETVAVLVDLIIPRTDTPGARDARVHEIVDSSVRPEARGPWREGLKWLDAQAGKRFTALTQPQQVALLTKASRDNLRFFKLAKDATIDGYYSTREGLAMELGWNFNTFLPEFKGCTHPEHQS